MRLRDWADRHTRRITHRHVLVGGWLVFLGYCFPGYMSYDSGVQLEQARGLVPMSSWHPPVMALLWKLCDAIIAGPILMLVIQSVTLLAGMYLILRRVLSDRAAALAAVLILLSPPVIPPMSTIWKDSQMAGFLMLGIAMMMRQTRAALVAGCVLIWLGTAQRYNAAAATLPILVLLFVWKDGVTRWKRYGLALGVWLAITLSAGRVNGCLAEQKEDLFAALAMNDIAGVIRNTSGYTDEEILADAPGLTWRVTEQYWTHVRRVYTPTMTWLDTTAENGLFRYPATPDESAAFAAAWRSMIVKHPVAYLRHRTAVFFAELRIWRREIFYLWWHFTDGAERTQKLEHDAAHSSLQTAWMKLHLKLVNTPVYWAWVYFVVGIVLVWLCRRDVVALTTVLSGVLCEAGLFLAAPAIDFRYSHWMITCTIVAAVCYLAARRKSRIAARQTPV